MSYGFLTDSQIAELRKVANKGLFRPFSVLRHTHVENDYGFGVNFAQVATGLGWLRNMNKPQTKEQGGQREGAEAKFRLHAEQGTDIRIGDQISMEGNLYVVSDVNDDDTIQIYRTALLDLVQ